MFMPVYSSLDRSRDELIPEMEAIQEKKRSSYTSFKARPFDQVIEVQNRDPGLKRYSELRKESDRNKLLQETSLSNIKNSIINSASRR
jgi:hypothetical protein